MQSLAPAPGAEYRGVMTTLSEMVRTEGVFRPVRGMSAVMIGAGPAHALYFSCYERIKEVMLPKVPTGYHNFVYGFAGCLATLLHDGIMTPADVVKQRMQMYNSPYSSCWDCVRKTYHSEGSRAFYRSYTTQLSMNIPFQTIHFMVYEFMQKATNKVWDLSLICKYKEYEVMNEMMWNLLIQERCYNPKAHMVSGALAGAIASAITTPLDVCKTLLNTQERSALNTLGRSQITGLWLAFTTVYRLGGVRGYFQVSHDSILDIVVF